MSQSTILPYIDTHTHLSAEEFDADRDEMIQRAADAGAVGLLLPSIDEESILPVLDICQHHPNLCMPMIGMHPTEMPDRPLESLERMYQILLAHKEEVVAVGEIGMDLYWDQSRKEEQAEVFRQQLTWATELQLPISIHAREAHREVFDILLPFASKIPGGVFHCFGGNQEDAIEIVEKFPHFALGIGGVLTFKKSTLPAILRSAVPIERIVIETDAPYLAPVPYRGKRNEPAYLSAVIEKLAQIYEMSTQEVAQILLENTYRIFTKLKRQ